MDITKHGISPYIANLPRSALKQMIHVVRDLQTLCEHPGYANNHLNLTPNAQINSSHYSVLMGYDFHMTEDGVAKLIEINTNAGGLWFSDRSYHPSITQFSAKLAQHLLNTFLADYRLFHRDPKAIPQLIAIIDQNPQEQFLYPEMQIFAQLFEQAGIECIVIDPSEVEEKNSRLYFNDKAIDLIYNRHCDFYFHTAEMALIAKAWQQQSVCITPNPKIYGLLADKQRMTNWCKADFLESLLPTKNAQRLRRALPKTHLLSELNQGDLWGQRKQWVFKPLNGYASRGVYVGDKLTKSKFNNFNPEETLIQERIKPSITLSPDGEKFKTDFRLFTYRKQTLAVSARLYQGQVTNLRTINGGFSRVTLI